MADDQKLKLTEDDLEMWRGNITKAREVRQKVSRWWDANLKKYAPPQDGDPEHYGEDINTNRDFTLVERKKADLFYQRPDVTPLPSPLFKDQAQLLETHGDILNEKLGLDGVNAKNLVHQVLFDVLCPSGRGWTEMGYEQATVDVPMQVETGQAPMQGAVLGLQSVPQIETVMAPVPVFEDCFWSHFSPYQGLVPHDVRTTNTDLWPWVGREVEIPLKVAKRKGWVPEDFAGSQSDQRMRFDNGLALGGADSIVKGQLIYYKSALYREDRPHPQHVTRLLLIDGVDTPAEHKDSPYQTLQNGRLTPDSLIGFPIHPLTIRSLTDSAYVPSDCTISRPLVNELNTFRRQMVESRDIMLVKYQYNVDTLPPDALNKIVRSPVGGFIGVPGEAFVGDGAIKEIPHGSYPRENFTVNDYIDNDLARTHAIDADQSGADSGGDQTATESQIKQNNVNARLGLERGVVLDWYIRGVTKYSTLIQRYLPVEDAAKIVGQEAAQAWDGWRHMVPSSLAFTALPDSALRTDVASERRRIREDYTYLANDPFINRQELLRESIPKMGYSMKVFNAEPPQRGPEPTRPTFGFTGDDLNPLNPQFPIVMEILRQAGVNVSQQAVQEAQAGAVTQAALGAAMPGNDTGQGAAGPKTEHGGKVPQNPEPLSKHAAALTGGMQGTGAAAPMGAGGQQ